MKTNLSKGGYFTTPTLYPIVFKIIKYLDKPVLWRMLNNVHFEMWIKYSKFMISILLHIAHTLESSCTFVCIWNNSFDRMYVKNEKFLNKL